MARMIRKQVYIEGRHQALLERLAKTTGVSEAEIIRQALDRRSGGAARATIAPDPAAWDEALRVMEELRGGGPLRGRRRSWKRADLYGERLSRYGRRAR